jgi:hypothetical protein
MTEKGQPGNMEAIGSSIKAYREALALFCHLPPNTTQSNSKLGICPCKSSLLFWIIRSPIAAMPPIPEINAWPFSDACC